MARRDESAKIQRYKVRNFAIDDPANDNFWLKKTTRFTISGGTRELNRINGEHLTKKDFYKAWLLIMQNDLLKYEGGIWVIDQDSKFYNPNPKLGFQNILFTNGDPLQPIKFSTGVDLQSADFPLTGKLDIILQDVFGFTGYTSLFTGFMTFSEETTGNFIIEFILHSFNDLSVLNREFNIQGPSHGVFRWVRSGELDSFYTDIFINGFSHVISDTTNPNFITPNRQAFLDEYFEIYQPLKSQDFEDARDIFLDGYLSDYFDQATKNEKFLIGKNRIFEFLARKVDDIVDVVFSAYGPYTMYDQFLEDPNIWAYRTRKQAKNWLRVYLEDPPDSQESPIAILKRILQNGNDGVISLQASGGGSGYNKLYGYNELFQDGLEIPISYDELVEFASYDKSDTFSDSILYVLQSPFFGISDNSFGFLDFRQFWAMEGEDIGNKLTTAFNILEDMFNVFNLGDLYDKEFKVRFIRDGGGGVSSNPRYTDFLFHPNNPTQLHNAIANTLTYLLLYPDSFVDIKMGKMWHFIFADLFSLHTIEYVKATTYTSTKVSGILMWDRNMLGTGLNREKYNTYMHEFTGIFDHIDQHHFSTFGSSYGDMLDIFEDFFRENFDLMIRLDNFRV